MGDCNNCGGSDEHPSQHCQDCSLLDHIPEGRFGKGCLRCGFTGLASGPVFDHTQESICPSCHLPQVKPPRAKRVPKPGPRTAWERIMKDET